MGTEAAYREGTRPRRVLVIPDRKAPLWIAGLVAVLSFAFGVLILGEHTQTRTLDCAREHGEVTCTLLRGSFGVTTKQVYPGASLGVPTASWRFHGDDTVYAVTIASPQGGLDLGPMDTEQQANELAAAISDFLHGDAQGHRVFRGQRVAWPLVAIALAMLTGAAFAPWISRRDDIVIDDDGIDLHVRRTRSGVIGTIAKEGATVRIEPLDEGETVLLVGRVRSLALSLDNAYHRRHHRREVVKRVEAFLRQ